MGIAPGEIIKFIKTKEYTFQRYCGQGGTGKTILIKDEVTDFNFICKKYLPYDNSKKTEYFKRFIDEIKIMYPLFHKNIVRIYNYYLYPDYTTGYILMEYIEGSSIDKYLFLQENNIYEDIFIQLIEGFEYLERNNVLHRDIRNDNILVTNNGTVKIIDFGFGKKIDPIDKEKASILLNWPVSDLPDEIHKHQYNHKTEVFFVGKLFNKILENNSVNDFRYQHVIDRMTITNPQKRINSFSDILGSISQDIFEDYDFTDEEKQIYLVFADQLTSHINSMINEIQPVTQPIDIIRSLEKVIRECLIEEYLQDNSKLISCFIKNGYNYRPKKDIYVDEVRYFYKFFNKLPLTKQEIVLSNLITRLKTIPIKASEDEIPF